MIPQLVLWHSFGCCMYESPYQYTAQDIAFDHSIWAQVLMYSPFIMMACLIVAICVDRRMNKR